jgi:hypothetical protein
MDVSEVICHECAFFNGLVSNSKVIGKVAAKSCEVIDNAERFADDALDDGHLVLPCGQRDCGEALVDWLGGGRVGVGGYETPDLSNGFIFPHFVGAEVQENPTS